MQNSLNNQKTISLNRSVLAHSEVTSAKKNRALGKHTKFCATPTGQGIEENRLSRNLRNSVIRLIRLFKIMSHAEGVNRVCNCQKKRIDSGLAVGVSYNSVHKTASYSNLQLCGSHWICPICSETHANARKQELQSLLVLLAKHRVYAHMLTLTVPHNINDSLMTHLRSCQKLRASCLKGSF